MWERTETLQISLSKPFWPIKTSKRWVLGRWEEAVCSLGSAASSRTKNLKEYSMCTKLCGDVLRQCELWRSLECSQRWIVWRSDIGNWSDISSRASCFLFIAAVVINKMLLYTFISAPSVSSSYRPHLFSLSVRVCACPLFHGALSAPCVGAAVPVLIFSCCAVFQRYLNCDRPSTFFSYTLARVHARPTLKPHLHPVVQTCADVCGGVPGQCFISRQSSFSTFDHLTNRETNYLLRSHTWNALLSP